MLGAFSWLRALSWHLLRSPQLALVKSLQLALLRAFSWHLLRALSWHLLRAFSVPVVSPLSFKEQGRLTDIAVSCLIGGICSAFLLSGLAHAEACQRGSLDPRYCDEDRDLLADAPSDADDQLHPRALIFAYTPVEDPAVYRDVWSDFLDHLEKLSGLRVVFFPVHSNAAQIEAMRSGRLHLAGFNTGSTPLAVNCAKLPLRREATLAVSSMRPIWTTRLFLRVRTPRPSSSPS